MSRAFELEKLTTNHYPLPSASPPQRHRPRHRMLKFAAIFFHIEIRVLQPEVPLRRTVGVVDQHQMWVIAQAFGLQFHRPPILLDKLRKDKLQHLGREWYPAKDVPCRNYVNTAMIAGDGRYGR